MFDAADELGSDDFKAGQLLIFAAMIPLRVPLLRPDQDKQLHIIGTYNWAAECFSGSAAVPAAG
jgi:hypothetical protein